MLNMQNFRDNIWKFLFREHQFLEDDVTPALQKENDTIQNALRWAFLKKVICKTI